LFTAQAPTPTPTPTPTPRRATAIANGRRDIMVSTYHSYAMAQAMPDARLVIYPDSGHGFLFQYPQAFADEVLRFLR
jgi:pimeloyl-ACP methyl ester carboxylesterase